MIGGPARRVVVAGFDLVFRPWLRHRIRDVYVRGPGLGPTGAPALLAANHVSWWDGFVIRETLRRLRPSSSLHTVMSAPELRRHPFLRHLGAVGLDPGSAGSVRRVLRELSTRLARDPDAVVLFFPQGRIWPSHRRPLGFLRGVEVFARRLALPVVPVALHLEPLTGVAPSFFVSTGAPLSLPDVAAVERAVELELDCMQRYLADTGEAAGPRWPGERL